MSSLQPLITGDKWKEWGSTGRGMRERDYSDCTKNYQGEKEELLRASDILGTGMCQQELAGSPPAGSGQLSASAQVCPVDPWGRLVLGERKQPVLCQVLLWECGWAGLPGAPSRSCALCKTHVLQNQGSTLILTYLEEIIKIQSRSCSDKAKSRASMLLIFILVLQLFIFLDDFSALCILLCTDLSKVALWLLQSSISQSILLLFWVSHPFQVGCVMTINIIINMRGNISHNQEPSVWREMFIIHNLLGSVNQPGSLCYSIMHH